MSGSDPGRPEEFTGEDGGGVGRGRRRSSARLFPLSSLRPTATPTPGGAGPPRGRRRLPRSPPAGRGAAPGDAGGSRSVPSSLDRPALAKSGARGWSARRQSPLGQLAGCSLVPSEPGAPCRPRGGGPTHSSSDSLAGRGPFADLVQPSGGVRPTPVDAQAGGEAPPASTRPFDCSASSAPSRRSFKEG